MMRYLLIDENQGIIGKELTWQLPYIIEKRTDGYQSPILPLLRNGILKKINIYCVGTPLSSTSINIYQNSALMATISISVTGLTTWTPSGTITCNEDDQIYYTITGSGLSACSITINQKWTNAGV